MNATEVDADSLFPPCLRYGERFCVPSRAFVGGAEHTGLQLEIPDDIVAIDNAMKWGFGWEQGPFEVWDAIGVKQSTEKMTAQGLEVPTFAQSLLDKEFDFTIDEYLELDRENAPRANTKAELDDLWRKRLKHEALNLKLTGKEWDAIVKTLKKRYKRIQRNITQYNKIIN